MKVFAATLATETNTFSPIPTGLDAFGDRGLYRGGATPDEPTLFTAPLWAAQQRAKHSNWEVVAGLIAFAQPAGVTTRVAYESLRDELLEDLRRALPVDIVLLGLHGAMVAEGYDDCEGDLLERVRAIVGPEVPVGAEIDPHCHLTARMVANATAIVAFKEYPHTDFVERAEELVELCARAAQGEIRPVMSLHDTRMLGIYHTPREPMRGFVDRMKALEGRDGVLSVSVAHGFPWGDVPDLGTRILVVTDGRAEVGASLAQALGAELKSLRGRTAPDYLTIPAALDRAAGASGTIVIADVSDNPGGGAPGDSTFLLSALLSRGVEDAALAPLFDPMAVRLCFEAGEGARLPLRIGGKTGPMSGDPLDVEAEVLSLAREAHQSFGTSRVRLGDSAAIRLPGRVDVVLTSVRVQAMGADLVTAFGIEPLRKRLLVVKSSQHFYAAFAPLASEVLYCAAPGAIAPDLAAIPYRRVRRPIWPLDPEPADLA